MGWRITAEKCWRHVAEKRWRIYIRILTLDKLDLFSSDEKNILMAYGCQNVEFCEAHEAEGDLR